MGLKDLIKNRVKLSLYDRILGQQAPTTDNIDMPELKGVDTSNPYYLENTGETPTVNITASQNPRVGGLLPDIINGFRENRNSSFDANNIGNNTLPDGRNKGFGYRLGEGLGTIARVSDTPVGRGLIAAGLIGLTGGSGLQSLAYGMDTRAGNRMNRTADTLYRDQLEQQGIDTSGVKGYLNDNMYKNMITAQQMKDNAEWRKAHLEAQRQAQEEAREDRRLERELRSQENALNRALTARGQDLSYSTSMANIGLQRDKMNQAYEIAARKAGADKKTMQTLTENNQTLADIDEGLRLIKENPNAYTWLKGKMGADIANRIDPKGVKTRTQIDNITAVYRKWLTGAQMSDQERKAYERFLPAPSDNAQIVQQKLEGMRNSIQRKNDVMMSGLQMGSAQSIDNDPLGIL